jgi:hypothetical protein
MNEQRDVVCQLSRGSRVRRALHVELEGAYAAVELRHRIEARHISPRRVDAARTTLEQHFDQGTTNSAIRSRYEGD